jgi:hypothetical protein
MEIRPFPTLKQNLTATSLRRSQGGNDHDKQTDNRGRDFRQQGRRDLVFFSANMTKALTTLTMRISELGMRRQKRDKFVRNTFERKQKYN